MEKTKSEIRSEILTNLSASLGVNVQEEGSVALAVVDVMIDEIYSLYRELDFMKKQAYLSTSSGYYTELIAELVNTEREGLQTDDDLKAQAQRSVYRHAGGNQIAIENAARSITGVADIIYRPYGLGPGSFILYVYPTPEANQVRLLNRVEEALDEVVSDGIYYEVRKPTDVTVELDLLIQFDEVVSPMERESIRGQIKSRVRRDINRLAMDEILYVNSLLNTIFNTSSHILDANIAEMRIDGKPKSITNTFPASEERFTAGDILII